MSVAQDVRDFIEKMDNGKLFSYEDIQNEKKSVVAIELSRLSKQGIVKRLSKGKYYKPKQGYFGEVPLSDNEVLKSYLAMPNTYVTGLKAFN
jgi:predicted transcriptional regulator of viral defense system